MPYGRLSLATLILITALTGLVIGPFSLAIHPVAGATPDNLTAFLVSLTGNPTALSPQNLGAGGGSTIIVPVPTVSSIDVISNQLLFSSSAATFTGKGFSATISTGGMVNMILQLEGPAGLSPDFCWGFKKNGSTFIDGGIGCSGGQNSGRVPLDGPGIISTQSFSPVYAAHETTVNPDDTIDFSIAFGQEIPSSGQTITVHYGGTTGQTTSFFQLPIAQPVTPVSIYLEATSSNPQALQQVNTGIGTGHTMVMPVQAVDLQTLINDVFSSPFKFTGTGFSGEIPLAGIVFFHMRFEGPAGVQPNICFTLTKNGFSFLDGFILCSSFSSPLQGPGVSVLETVGFIYLGFASSLTPSDTFVFSLLVGEPSATPGEQVTLHYGGGTPESTSSFQIPMILPALPPPSPPLTVTTRFTDTSGNALPVDSSGKPRVDVVLTSGTVRSTNPGQLLATANITNTGSTPLQSLRANLTLPTDWAVHPDWIPAKGAIQVLLANNTSLANSLDITQPSTISVSGSNPQLVQLAIPSFNNTLIGHAFMPGQSILLTAKLAYALKGTSQAAASYPRNYTDTASAMAWTGPSFAGAAFAANASGMFVAKVKVLGDVNGDLKVDIVDVAVVAYSFGSRPGDPRWNPSADVNNRGVIDIEDVAYVAYYFGTSA